MLCFAIVVSFRSDSFGKGKASLTPLASFSTEAKGDSLFADSILRDSLFSEGCNFLQGGGSHKGDPRRDYHMRECNHGADLRFATFPPKLIPSG